MKNLCVSIEGFGFVFKVCGKCLSEQHMGVSLQFLHAEGMSL